jgi:hypothetical protein
MTDFRKYIDQQIATNKGRNLFLEDSFDALHFIDDIIVVIHHMGNIEQSELESMIDYTCQKAMEEFCRINQYFSFSEREKSELRTLYADLFENIRQKKLTTTELSKRHYRNLRQLIQQSNAFAEKMYSQLDTVLEPVPCSEYSAELQLFLLDIDISTIQEPLLDIGCGSQGTLVRYFRKLEIEAQGFDRSVVNQPYLSNAHWLEFDFGVEKWGTLVSNIAFSNHFCHHNQRIDGDFEVYARKYMEILNSLKVGGTFYYAPSLPFIETYLDSSTFSVSNHRLTVKKFESSKIVRLK